MGCRSISYNTENFTLNTCMLLPCLTKYAPLPLSLLTTLLSPPTPRCVIEMYKSVLLSPVWELNRSRYALKAVRGCANSSYIENPILRI